MSGRLAILGGGGHGRVAADCALMGGWDEVSIFDDDPARKASGPWAIAGTGRDLLERHVDFDGVVVGIGLNAVRLDWHRRLAAAGARMTTLVHPAASLSRQAVVGSGSVVFAGGVVNIGAVLGEAVIINTGATVDHDCVLGDGVHVSPGGHLAGGVRVGALAWIGLGAAVRENITIGAGCVVGAGAVVVRDVEEGQTVIGIPARNLRN